MARFSKAILKWKILTGHKTTTIEVGLISALAFMLRLVNLESWPRWYVDEGTYGLVGMNAFRGIIGLEGLDPSFPISLFTLLIGGLSILFGKSFFIIRLPSIISGTLAIILLYFIVRRLYNRPIAFISSLLLTVSTVYIDRSATGHSFTLLFLLLTVWFYIKACDTNQKKWIYAMGASAGLAFISKLVGIFSLIFLILQSAWDRRLLRNLPALLTFSLIASVYPVTGIIYGWEYFLHDLFGVSTGSPNLNWFLSFLLMGRPESTLREMEKLAFNPWSTLGFISLPYLIKRNGRGEKLILNLFFSTLIVCLGLKIYWWGHLAFFYAIYAVSISTMFYSMATTEEGFEYAGIFLFLLLLPLFTTKHLWWLYSVEYGVLLFFLLFLVLLILAPILYSVRENRGSALFKQVFRGNIIKIKQTLALLVIVFLCLIVLSSILYNLRFINSNIETRDQKATVNFLNSNTTPEDMVAVSESLLYALNVRAYGYYHVACYNTHVDAGFILLNKDDLPRYRIDLSLSKLKYFVLDREFWLVANGQYANLIVPKLNQWFLVAEFGDYKVYQNPMTLTNNWVTISRVESAEDWRIEAGSGLIAVDEISKVEGKKRVIATLHSDQNGRANIAYDPEGYFDLSDREFLMIDVSYSQTGWAEYYIGARDMSNRYRFWTFNYLVENRWETIILPLESYSIQDYGFDLTSVNYILVGVNDPSRPNTAITIAVDYIGVITRS